MSNIEKLVDLCEKDDYFSHLYGCYQQQCAAWSEDGDVVEECVAEFVDFCYFYMEDDMDDALASGDKKWMNRVRKHIDVLDKEVEKLV